MEWLSQSFVVTMDLMSSTRTTLLRLREELNVEVQDDRSDTEIRRVILENNSDLEYLQNFSNLILTERNREQL